MAVTTSVSALVRCLAAAALAVAWIGLTGLPAAAEVTDWGVERPRSGAVIDRAESLIVYVNRAASPPDEEVEVHTRVLDAAGEPVSDTIIALQFVEQRITDPPGSDQLRYAGSIDPAAFAWLRGGAAPNGRYTLQVRVLVRSGDVEREPSPWRNHSFMLDAPPEPPSGVTAAVADPDASTMTVKWKPSRTPDVSHYVVERRVDGGPWTVARDNVDPTATDITDTVDGFGDYRYRVVAARPAGVDSSDEPAEGPDVEPGMEPGADPAAGNSAEDSRELRFAASEPSSTVEFEPASEPERGGPDDRDSGSGDGASTGGNGADTSGSAPVAPPAGSDSDLRIPSDANQTYKGPLDYGVEPKSVTERVPVSIAKGGGTQEGGVLEVVDRSIDRERVLPAVAGGLILVLSAAHVVRFLNE